MFIGILLNFVIVLIVVVVVGALGISFLFVHLSPFGSTDNELFSGCFASGGFASGLFGSCVVYQETKWCVS